jgi:PAS domain S-box-containing protein
VRIVAGAPSGTRPSKQDPWCFPNWAIETSTHSVVGIDRHGKIVAWNPGSRRLFGYTFAEVKGKSLGHLLPPERRTRTKTFLASLLRGHTVEYREAVCVRKGGRRVDVAFTAIPQGGPHTSFAVLIVRDISERKGLENKLADTISMLEGAQGVAHLSSWQWDIGKDQVTWSVEFNRMLGLDRSVSRATFKKLLARVSPEDRKDFQEAVEKTVREGVPYRCRHGLTRAGGSRLEVLSQGRLIEGPTPGDRRLVGVSQEVGTLPGAEQARRALRDQGKLASEWARRGFLLVKSAAVLFDTFDYAAALRHLAELIVPGLADRSTFYLLEADGSVLCLPVAGAGTGPGGAERVTTLDGLGDGPVSRVLKTGEYEVWSRNARDPAPPRIPDPERYHLGMGRSARSVLVLPLRTRRGIAGAWTLIQTKSRRPERSRDLRTHQALARLAGMAIENGQLYRQATDLNQELEAKVHHRTEELREALRDLDEYASSVAHDLKAPLRAIRAFTEALMEDLGDLLNEQGKDYAARIRAACDRLDSFISDLLAYSRVCRRDVTLAPIKLGSLLEDVAHYMGGELAERGARLQFGRTAESVMANPTLLAQVLTNLITNAAKFVSPGRSPEIQVRVERRDAGIRVWVEDNGIGIAPEHLEAIFRPFERLHPVGDYPGTGLGLAIVKKAMDRMGGAAGAESEVGIGSRFWIELKAAPLP